MRNARTLKSHRAECFYNRDGKWYYAGIYKAFQLDDLTTKEWEALSSEVRVFVTFFFLVFQSLITFTDRSNYYQRHYRWSQKHFTAERVRDSATLRCRRSESSVHWVAMCGIQQFDVSCDPRAGWQVRTEWEMESWWNRCGCSRIGIGGGRGLERQRGHREYWRKNPGCDQHDEQEPRWYREYARRPTHKIN